MINSEQQVPPDGWRFMSFCAQRGTDAVQEWLIGGIPIGERNGVWTYFRTTLWHLRVVPRWLWRRPQFDWLKGDKYKDIGEVRFKYKGVAYRPLGCFGPERDQFTACKKVFDSSVMDRLLTA